MFDPMDYAKLAKELPSRLDLPKEARTRAALSRAYYSLFLAVCRQIRSAQGRPVHGRHDRIEHGKVPLALYGPDEPALASIAKFLEELYTARIHADYELEPDEAGQRLCLDPRKAARLARRVEEVIRALDRMDFSQVAKRPEVA